MDNNWKKDYQRYRNFISNIIERYKSKPNLKIYLELMMSITTIVIFVIFAIRPTIITILELNKEIQKKEVVLTQLKTKVKNLQTAGNLIRSEALNIRYVDLAIPTKSNPETLIKQLEELSNQNSLNLMSVTLSDVVIFGDTVTQKKKRGEIALPENAMELPFTLSAAGSYQNIINYLKAIENMKRPVMIDNLSINSNIKDTEKIIVLTITGRVPFYDI